MARRKEYKSELMLAEPAMPEASGGDSEELDVVVLLPFNPRGRSKLDLTADLGHGMDAWVIGAAEACRRRVASGIFAPATVIFHVAGLQVFFRFLRETKPVPFPASPSDLTEHVATRFIAWLRLGYPRGNAAKNHYAGFRATVQILAEYGRMPKAVAQRVPPGNFKGVMKKSIDGDGALSQGEMQRLAQALKSDLADIYHGRFAGSGADATAVMLLIIAMRTGLNTTPMLEMPRDCLRPHPFMPGMMLIDTIKRRASGAQSTAVNQTKHQESATAVRMDAVAVLRMALAKSEQLAAEAPGDVADRVWLYRVDAERGGHVSHLTQVKLGVRIKALVSRHHLVDDDGGVLGLTLGRLRKTMENRLWRLTDGDIIAVSAAMGHKPSVADAHYLSVDTKMKAEGALFLSGEFTAKLRHPGMVETPTGSCQDSLHGTLAPKDGSNHCDKFTKCLGCPSFALVGEDQDLHRFFSFQKFLEVDALSYAGHEWSGWREQRESLMVSMEGIAVQHFGSEAVERAKQKVAAAPHPFWEIQMRRAAGGRTSP